MHSGSSILVCLQRCDGLEYFVSPPAGDEGWLWAGPGCFHVSWVVPFMLHRGAVVHCRRQQPDRSVYYVNGVGMTQALFDYASTPRPFGGRTSTHQCQLRSRVQRGAGPTTTSLCAQAELMVKRVVISLVSTLLLFPFPVSCALLRDGKGKRERGRVRACAVTSCRGTLT